MKFQAQPQQKDEKDRIKPRTILLKLPRCSLRSLWLSKTIRFFFLRIEFTAGFSYYIADINAAF
jgi:hypothetical protein